MSARSIIAALGGRWHGGYGMAKCPTHTDRTPSLSIRDGRDGQILVYCHGGCSQLAVLNALRRLGLWDDPRTVGRRFDHQRHRLEDDGGGRTRKALALWRRRLPVQDSLAQRYLREVRGVQGPIPATLGFLAPSKTEHAPALIAAFGIADELEPGVLAISDAKVKAVHLTLLRPDGSGKADIKPNKVMVGPVAGSPITLSSMNDLLGLAITEGIEDGLSISTATSLGVWTAGSASLMPHLGDIVPDYVDCVTIVADDDAGRRGAEGLALRLRSRRIHVESVILRGIR